MEIDVTIVSTVRAGTALLFASGLAHKLRNPGDFRQTLGQYLRGFGVAKPWLVTSLACVVIALECAVLAACVWPGQSSTAALLAATALLLYAGSMALNIARGNLLLDCGCTWGQTRQAVSTALVLRNVVLAAIALTMALPVSGRPMLLTEAVSVALATVAMALLYGAANQMLIVGNPDPRNRS